MNDPKKTPPSPSPPDPGVREEPEITQEESVPSDGKDPVGEKMMDELGRERGRASED